MEKTEPGASLGTEFQPGPCTGGSWGVLSSPVGRVPSYHCLERPGGGRGPPGGGLHPSPGGDRVRASQRAGRGVTASLQPRPRPAPPAWRNPGGGGGRRGLGGRGGGRGADRGTEPPEGAAGKQRGDRTGLQGGTSPPLRRRRASRRALPRPPRTRPGPAITGRPGAGCGVGVSRGESV